MLAHRLQCWSNIKTCIGSMSCVCCVLPLLQATFCLTGDQIRWSPAQMKNPGSIPNRIGFLIRPSIVTVIVYSLTIKDNLSHDGITACRSVVTQKRCRIYLIIHSYLSASQCRYSLYDNLL